MYPYSLFYMGNRHILLWVSSEDGDYFKTDKNNELYCAKNPEDAKVKFEYFSDKIIWPEGSEINFDIFWEEIDKLSCNQSTATDICELILNGWNFIEDLIKSLSLNELLLEMKQPILCKIYKKFFYGNNIDAVTPNGTQYNPEWDEEELQIFRKTLKSVWCKLGNHLSWW